KSYLFNESEPCERGRLGMRFIIFCMKSLPFGLLIKNSRPSGLADMFVTMPNNAIMN
ncbi:hypothetical protein WN55_10100, partial [Dufourea novaeangliae]